MLFQIQSLSDTFFTNIVSLALACLFIFLQHILNSKISNVHDAQCIDSFMSMIFCLFLFSCLSKIPIMLIFICLTVSHSFLMLFTFLNFLFSFSLFFFSLSQPDNLNGLTVKFADSFTNSNLLNLLLSSSYPSCQALYSLTPEFLISN